MIAIVTAGGQTRPGDPLYETAQGGKKAMVEIAGKPMIQWVLDALDAATTVERVIIIGLPDMNGLKCQKLAALLPSRGSLLLNTRDGMSKALELDPQSHHFLVTSSDIPAITAEIVDWLVNTTMQTDLDAYYNVITRQVMEARYPGSRRSYIRFTDLEVCGGDISVIRSRIGAENDALWERIIESRKNAFKQASLIGFDTLLLLLLRRLSLQRAVEIVTRRLHLTGQAVVCPYAEVGMDVDKPFQLEIIRADLERQFSSAAT